MAQEEPEEQPQEEPEQEEKGGYEGEPKQVDGKFEEKEEEKPEEKKEEKKIKEGEKIKEEQSIKDKIKEIVDKIKEKIQELRTERWIKQAAEKYDVDPNLIKAIIKKESSFNPNAVGTRGEQGLMQLMPGTAKDMEVTDRTNPKQNIEGGTKYIKQQLDKHNSLEEALAAYNAGPGNVKKYGGVPPFPKTQQYIKDVLKYYKEYSEGK